MRGAPPARLDGGAWVRAVGCDRGGRGIPRLGGVRLGMRRRVLGEGEEQGHTIRGSGGQRRCPAYQVGQEQGR